LENTKVD
jgi:hypothetical protein